MQHARKHLMLQKRWPTKARDTGTNRPWPTSVSRSSGRSRYGSKLPACLKAGMEAISGLDLQRVRVHYNSEKPAEVDAQAYAQGLDIYLAPDQEHHLPHELGHVVQQTLGMVQPTREVNGVAINDDARLEQSATELGEEAMRVGCGVRNYSERLL